jgi:hypothetical protein
VLTNGLLWWVYLSFSEGSFEQRKCRTIDLVKLKPADAAARLVELLGRENVASGKALKTAENLNRVRQRRVLETSLTEAWKSLLTDPNDSLVKLLGEAAEKRCGFRIEPEKISAFLRGRLEVPAAGGEIVELTQKIEPEPQSFEGHTIRSFTLKGKSYEVDAWDRFLVTLCEVLMTRHGQDIDKLLWHSVDNRFYFKDNPSELRLPVNIEGSNLFAETRLSPDDTVKVARSVLELFNFDRSDLRISVE